ncbi:preprotein translocase subunit SecY [Kiritimatiellaeota bacterium B1221]|nr:preprotein translocase subunit SecY [Kiritimatiellaeota bacterium B1221]
MLSAFANSLKIPELRQRIFFTFALIFLCRILTAVPAPGVSAAALRELMDSISQSASGAVNMANLFSGGALSRFAIGALGIMPYISASIIIQLMTAVVPSLERLSREGESGRAKINQYTRYLTLILCAVQGFSIASLALNAQQSFNLSIPVVTIDPWAFRLLATVALTASTMLMMWLGEQITERGIGNGVSLIITVNILGSLPDAVRAASRMFFPGGNVVPTHSLFHLVTLIVLFFLVVAATVAITQATRRIPVQYARRVVGRKTYGGQSTYMPLKVNYAGVMPIIFAQAILMFPPPVLNYIGNRWDLDNVRMAAGWFQFGSTPFMWMYSLMILFFSYFWVATQFNPVQIADDLKRNGGYIPGIRPGTPTANFLDNVMTRITLAGALSLTLIAVIPTLLGEHFNINFIITSFFGGTSLLIIVGVMLDTMRQIESHLLNRHYDGFLNKGKLRGRK